MRWHFMQGTLKDNSDMAVIIKKGFGAEGGTRTRKLSLFNPFLFYLLTLC